MKNCTSCNGRMVELGCRTPEGISDKYFRCKKCGEEIVDMKQLHNVADKYRELKRYTAKLSKWGQIIGFRIPKELTVKYRFKEDEEVTIIPEEQGIKVVPA